MKSNMPQMNSPKGMPSILGDITPPYSAPRSITGVAPEFDDLYTTWQTTKTPENNTKVLAALQPVIDTAVSSYGGANATPNLKSRAKLMALKALDTYDPKRGNVRTHLLSQLQSLRRLSAKEQHIISLPEQVGLDFQKLTLAENELTDALGRDPTDDELADHTNLSTRRIRKIRAFNQPLAEGSVSRVTEESAGGDVASHIPGSNRGTDAWMNFVYDDLGPTDKMIMDMTLGRNGRRRASTQDIASRLKITPGAVSQRAAKIQQMLDKRFDYGGF
jgi:DNA-directed RNA polymerase specialized sigma subunit